MPNPITEPIKGTAYHLGAVTIHVHEVRGGEVYYQKFRGGVECQPWFEDLWRMPVATFLEQAASAVLELPPSLSYFGA